MGQFGTGWDKELCDMISLEREDEKRPRES